MHCKNLSFIYLLVTQIWFRIKIWTEFIYLPFILYLIIGKFGISYINTGEKRSWCYLFYFTPKKSLVERTEKDKNYWW